VDLDEFIEVHYRSLLRTAFLLTGDRYAGEDLLQDVLATSWVYAQRSTIEQPGAFLRRCLVNAYISQRRRRGRRREDAALLTGLPDPVRADVTDHIATRDAMWRALASLPRHQRAILVLRFYEDMSEAQIAQLLGVGVGSVRGGSWRGLERLRKTLALDTEDQHA